MSVRAIELTELHDHTNGKSIAYTKVVITDEHPILAAALARALSASRRHVNIASSPAALTDELVVTAALADGDSSEIHWRALAQAQAFRRAGGKSLILLQDTGGQFTGGPSQGWLGGMAALARTAALEWPEMTVRCIDIAVDSDDISGTTRRLVKALESSPSIVGVDLSGRLYSMQYGDLLSQPMLTSTLRSTHDTDVWLVSGGARGVTASCIESLAKRTPGRFALLGRSVLAPWPSSVELTGDIKVLRRLLAASFVAAGERPSPKDIERVARQALAGQEIRNTLERFQDAGIAARYYPCDISDPQQVKDVVAKIQNDFGQVTALVHGAGVLADSMLVDKTSDEFDRVFKTKVDGLQNLLNALGDKPLSYAAFFSSAAAFYGNTGQGDYAMANEVLNRVAQMLKRRWPEALVKSFNWGPWDSGMVDQTLARYFKERGISLIPVKEGAALFANEMLAGDRDHVELLVGDPWKPSGIDSTVV